MYLSMEKLAKNVNRYCPRSSFSNGVRYHALKSLIAVALALPLLFAWPSCAQISATQSAGADFDAALGQLAFQITGPLEKERVKRVIVADLLDANGRSHPVGRFLADKLSTVLLRDYPALETISFSHSQSVLDDSVPRDVEQASQETRKWAKKLGARVVITGSFAKAPEGIGISLTAMKTSSGQTYAQTNGVVPISEEINSVSAEPIPSPKAEIARQAWEA